MDPFVRHLRPILDLLLPINYKRIGTCHVTYTTKPNDICQDRLGTSIGKALKKERHLITVGEHDGVFGGLSAW